MCVSRNATVINVIAKGGENVNVIYMTPGASVRGANLSLLIIGLSSTLLKAIKTFGKSEAVREERIAGGSLLFLFLLDYCHFLTGWHQVSYRNRCIPARLTCYTHKRKKKARRRTDVTLTCI